MRLTVTCKFSSNGIFFVLGRSVFRIGGCMGHRDRQSGSCYPVVMWGILRDAAVAMGPLLFWSLAASVASAEPTTTSQGQATGVKRVLVLETESAEIPEAVAPAITGQITEYLATLSEISAVNLEELGELLVLEADKIRFGCEENVACLAKISEAAKAELVLSSSAGKLGSRYVLSLTLVNASKATAVGRMAENYADVDALLAGLPKLLGSLFATGSATAASRFHLPEGKSLSFAVFDLKTAGISDEIAKNLTQILSTQIGRIAGSTVITGDDIRSMLQLAEGKQKMGCEDDTLCFAEIGGALGVDKLVIGQVGKLAERFIISLRLVDVREARVDSRRTDTFRGQEEQLIRAVRLAARNLLGVAADGTGSLALASDQQEVAVHINGEEKGELPMPPLTELPAGVHTVRLTKSGYLDWQSQFFIAPDEATPMWVSLQEAPAPWYKKWWVWTIAGTVVAGSAGIIAYALTRPSPPQGDTQPIPFPP